MEKIYQIELTTRCNLKCFYCPIEELDKKDMSFSTFKSIIDSIEGKAIILMQGTGESLLHKQFHGFLVYLKLRGHKATLITNGTMRIPDKTFALLDRVKYSIDEYTSDKKVKVLKGNEENITIDPKSSIFMVDYGQDPTELLKHTKINAYKQKLQQKDSYTKKYSVDNKQSCSAKECSFIKNDRKFFFASGKEAACCLMIFEDKSMTSRQVKKSLAAGVIPDPCKGCFYLTNDIPKFEEISKFHTLKIRFKFKLEKIFKKLRIY